MRNSKYILTWYNRDMLKEDLIWQCNMTNNLNLMQSGIIKIIKISVYGKRIVLGCTL